MLPRDHPKTMAGYPQEYHPSHQHQQTAMTLDLAQSHAEAALSLSLIRHNNNNSGAGGLHTGLSESDDARSTPTGEMGGVELEGSVQGEVGPKRTRKEY